MDSGIRVIVETHNKAYIEDHDIAYHYAKTVMHYTDVNARAYADSMTKAKFKAKAKADADADISSKPLIRLRNLATDCLRLSMHFFHPIQQCAQQVYHTAVPLSPASSQLCKSYLQTIIENHLSHVTDFVEPPDTWGVLLRTIDVRPRQLTYVITSGQSIISACEDIMNIYDAITGVLQQSICVPETVTKIQGSPDGSTLVLAHSSSVTMWDVQTGGLIHTFTTQPTINDIAVSTTHIACGLSDGSVMFWSIQPREEGKGFGNGQPVIAIYWLSTQVLAVATQSTLYIHNITVGESSIWFSTSRHIWGMVHLRSQLIVGTSWKIPWPGQDQCFFKSIEYTDTLQPQPHEESWVHNGQLENPILVGKDIACTAPATGVQLFDTTFTIPRWWAENSPLLGAVRSLAVSLGRNIVVQTDDSIQIFSGDVLTNRKTCEMIRQSHVYPLGKKHIICVQSDRRLAVLELETLQELRPDNDIWSLLKNLPLFGSHLTNQSPFACASLSSGSVAKFGISSVMQAWKSGTQLPEWTETAGGNAPLSGLSPMCTWVVTVRSSPEPELRIEDAKHGTLLANLPLEHGDMGMGKVYDLSFDSETRFYLMMDGPGWHVTIPYDITPQPSGFRSHTITRGEPVPFSGPRATPPYKLDANCEWVIDPESRKICWISPGNLRRGDGGHFWAGLSLVMVGDDGVVRKLTFKEPDC